MSVEIRRYLESDRQQLLGLWENTFDDAGPHNRPVFMLNSKLAIDDNIYIASGSNEILGAIISGYDGHRGWLYSLAVKQSSRRQGIGKQLVEFSVEILRTMGCVKVNLQIREENSEVISFYQSLGFTTEERISMGKRLS
jgi:ribosomal protein S18 acetylase RimI-like enzyme